MQLSNLERARYRGACAAGIGYRRARGFSLMEVMVALVVSTVGLLGLAKMEALAMSSTGIASSCTLTGASSCNPQAMAFNDLNQWAGAVSQVLPGYLATIACSQASFPVTCTIQLQWTENGVAVNAQQTQMNSLTTPTYVLFVQP
jgi:type IV pilus assembly protein PilV